MSSYSVFIPRIFANISEARIIQIFHSLAIGEVDHVDLLRKIGNNGEPYNMGFVHFKQLYHNSGCRVFSRRCRECGE